MSMSVGTSNGEEDEIVSAINTTPLVDVMLVLLIIFLITIPVVTTSIPVSLPKERNEIRETKPENIVISVDATGRIFWNDLRIATTAALIDVMLVLLVMLIITIPIQLHSVNLNMPIGNPPPPLVLPEVVKIDIDPSSVVYWNGLPLADRAALEENFKAAAAQAVQPELHLRPDKNAKYAIVAGVMVSAQRLGLTKIGIVGSEQFIE